METGIPAQWVCWVGRNKLALTLGIETSCDETSVALVEDGRRVVSNVIHSQVDLHQDFGGVVPELAARDHLERLPGLVELAFEKAGASPDDIGLIAVTRGPGLAGCLLVGVGVAEGLSASWSRPLTGVNHLWGHIYAAMLARPDLEPPLLGLVVSGAHSDLVRMPEHGRFEVIGRTRDDAAGEAFDKAARMLGLGYPGDLPCRASSSASAGSRPRCSTAFAIWATPSHRGTKPTWRRPSSARWWSR